MTDRSRASALLADFRGALGARLVGQGWVVDAALSDRDFTAVALQHPLHSGFVATAEVTKGLSVPERLPLELVAVRVGVGYDPVRRLSWLLGEREVRSLLTAVAADLGGPRDDSTLKIADAGDIASAVELIAAVVLDQGLGFAGPLANVELLLDTLETGSRTRVMLLAASGRLDEARAALERYAPDDATGFGRDSQHERLAFQLTRWLDSGGDPALLPDGPPSPAFDLGSMPSVGEIWRDSRARDAAVKATRKFVGDLERDELRARLAEELASRGASMNPLKVEQTLDWLTSSPAERREQTFEGFGMLAKLGSAAVKAIRERSMPNLTPPDWINPPAHAAYRFPRDQHDRWTRVELHDEAGSWLDRVHASTPGKIGSTVSVPAWVDWDHDKSTLAIHLGETRVGHLDPDQTDAYRPVMEAAAQRAELPRLKARLTHRTHPPGYLLEITGPPRRPEDQA